MRRSRSTDKKRCSQPRSGSRKLFGVAVTLVLVCIVGSSMLAQVTSRKKAKSISNEVSVMNLSPTTPSKEYIYAGSKLVATEEPISFLDVNTSTPFYNDILKIARRRVTVGCGGGNYCPNDPVNREQMAAFIIKALGNFNPPTPTSQRFTDVPPSDVFYNFVEQMAVLQITVGCNPDHTLYCPGDTVPHEQMATFIVRALHPPPPPYTPPTPSSQRFTDVPPNNVFYAFIDEYASRGIWRGCNDVQNSTTFCPGDPVTRAQMAHILVQAFGANWQ
jgi:S-layer homology domain